MEKGFTLIELLIVMVIVGVLVAVALPKYQTALERGRALEGISNLRWAAERLNAEYIINGNSYPSLSGNPVLSADTMKSKFFGLPTWESGEDNRISIQRLGSDWNYSLYSVMNNGETTGIFCWPEGSEDDCQRLDLTGNLLN